MYPRVLTNLLDYIYPPSCHQCAVSTEGGRYLCSECVANSTRLTAPFCEKCGEAYEGKIDQHFVCPNCQDLDFSFTFAKAALRNTHANHQLVVDFKYLKKFYLAGELARFCADAIENDPRFAELPSPVLVPVPLHWKRKWRRGFNQAEELAHELSQLTGIPVKRALRRSRNTKTQTQLGRKARLNNLKGAFKLHKLAPEFRSVILIDDVFTTGSTATACAAALEKHTPQLENIVVLTALRG